MTSRAGASRGPRSLSQDARRCPQRLGRIGGITVGAHWPVAVILVIIAQVLAVSVLPAAHPHERPAVYWTVGIIAAALFLGSLLAHELAHALVARRSGSRSGGSRCGCSAV